MHFEGQGSEGKEMTELTNLYNKRQSVDSVMKLFETRSATSSAKKSPGFCIVCGKIATTERGKEFLTMFEEIWEAIQMEERGAGPLYFRSRTET
jgi:hypothetical protein